MGQSVAWISETGAFFSLFVADILPFVVPELSVSPGSLLKKCLGGQHRNPVRTSLLATVPVVQGMHMWLDKCIRESIVLSSITPSRALEYIAKGWSMRSRNIGSYY
jgi:hypothetical protein